MTRKILVIDDEPDILTMVARRLKANQYQVTTAGSGEEGLELAKKYLPDLVLLDYVMPDMRGDVVLKHLKEDAVLSPVPVVVFTADAKEVKPGEIQKLGASGCLFKPFTTEELLGTIRSLLGENA